MMPQKPQQKQQRVLADGWGAQASGSVFCADSSLRFIYESHGGGNPLASLSAEQQQQQQQQQQHPGMYKPQIPTQMTVAGKRPRENSSDGHVPGVDVLEAEVARACSAIARQTPSLPHTFRECSVCLSANAYAQMALCGHTFHPECFLRWFRRNRSCPLCRGAVAKVRLAEPLPVQDELEAIMAEIDDDPLTLLPMQDAGQATPTTTSTRNEHADVDVLDDPLLTNSEQLMSFLATEFDTDMELAALDELAPATGGMLSTLLEPPHATQEADGDESMAMELDDGPQAPTSDKSEAMATYAGLLAPTPPTATTAPMPQQFAPSSAVPNYWNVLNQGLLPSTPTVAPQRPMVHIAPKPDARVMTQQAARVAPSARASGEPVFKASAFTPHAAPVTHTPHSHSHSHSHSHAHASTPAPPRVVSCRCTGGCRNGRCACVKEGGMCGASCRCTSCKNPFLMVKAAGADIEALLQDDCFMHNVSKTRDMVQRLQEPVAVPCCASSIKVIDCVQGYTCAACERRYDFSWCMNKLLDSARTPRNHCAICKRCCDHRDVHCNDCGRCYFAGVAASLPCPCKEASHHKKRREALAKDKAEDEDEEAEGECCIM